MTTIIPRFPMMRKLWNVQETYDETDRAVFNQALIGAMSVYLNESEFDTAIETAKRVMSASAQAKKTI